MSNPTPAPIADAIRLMEPFASDIGAAPIRVAPERQDELRRTFGGSLPSLTFGNHPPPQISAVVSDKKVYADYASLLSLWATAKAGYQIGDAGMRATRQTQAAIAAGQPEPAELALDRSTVLAEAYALVDAAKATLRAPAAPWPLGLPAPNVAPPAGSDEERVNWLFLGAAGWVFLHEYAHIALGHQKATTADISNQQEREADDWATRWLFDAVPNETYRWFRTIAVATGLSWLGLNDLVFRGGTVHPHASERFLHCRRHFGGDELNPGVEVAGYVVKAIFDPKARLAA